MIRGVTIVSVLLFISLFVIVMYQVPLFYAMVIAATVLFAAPVTILMFMIVHGIVRSIAFLLDIDPSSDD